MYTKIFFDDKPLFLCDKIDSEIEPYAHHDDAVLIDELNSHTITTMIHEMRQDKIHAGIFLHSDLEELRNAFFKKFKIIQAGGGLIRNERGQTLLIFRRGKWDMPKGKLDDGETLAECAVREVKEETGLRDVKLIAPLIITYHTYDQGTKHVLKESHWYTMEAPANEMLTPQTEEDIEQIIWADDEDLFLYKENAFPSILDVLKAGIGK
jgi:8-oxo-dGTP pyrophosphatase MutT (NUDIX family)